MRDSTERAGRVERMISLVLLVPLGLALFAILMEKLEATAFES